MAQKTVKKIYCRVWFAASALEQHIDSTFFAYAESIHFAELFINIKIHYMNGYKLEINLPGNNFEIMHLN